MESLIGVLKESKQVVAINSEHIVMVLRQKDGDYEVHLSTGGPPQDIQNLGHFKQGYTWRFHGR